MNETIAKIFAKDQRDRKKYSFSTVDPKFFPIRDKKRREEVLALIKNRKIITGSDYFKAAMIFHHGASFAHLKRALSLIKKCTGPLSLSTNLVSSIVTLS